MLKTYTARLTAQEVADLLFLGTQVRHVHADDPAVYVIVKHLLDDQAVLVRNLATGETRRFLWDEVDFF